MTKPQPSRRLLIFQETRNPHNTAELIYLPVNKLGLPICGDGPELPSILELPLHILKVFTDIFNQPKYKGWYVCFAFHPSPSSLPLSWFLSYKLIQRRGVRRLSMKLTYTPLRWKQGRSIGGSVS